jgi:hypothetical protein
MSAVIRLGGQAVLAGEAGTYPLAGLPLPRNGVGIPGRLAPWAARRCHFGRPFASLAGPGCVGCIVAGPAGRGPRRHQPGG